MLGLGFVYEALYATVYAKAEQKGRRAAEAKAAKDPKLAAGVEEKARLVAEAAVYYFPSWKFRMLGGALLQLLNQVAHVYIVYRFYASGLWLYFYGTAIIFCLNSLFCAYMGCHDEMPWLAVPLGLIGLEVPYEAIQSALLGLNQEYEDASCSPAPLPHHSCCSPPAPDPPDRRPISPR